jgi:hypothetical protein
MDITTDPFDPAIDYVVCIAVSDLHKPHVADAEIEECCKCGEHIWVAPSSLIGKPKICIACALLLDQSQ